MFRSESLKKLLTEKGFRITDIARHSELSPSTLSMMFNRTVSPGVSRLRKLAAGLESLGFTRIEISNCIEIVPTPLFEEWKV